MSDEEHSSDSEGSPNVDEVAPLAPKEIKRRKLRQDYHNLIEDTLENKQLLSDPSRNDLIENIGRGNDLFKEVHHAREGALDSQWLATAARIGVEQCSKISVGKQFDPIEFMDRIKSKYSKRTGNAEEDGENIHLDWERLGRDVAPCFYKYAPSITFMAGPISSEEKVKERKKAVRRKVGDEEAVAPEELTVQQNEENETTKRVVRVSRKLGKAHLIRREEKKETTFEELLVHPQSFTKTIEDIFYFSFLVKDGRASMERSNDHLVIKPAVPPVENERNVQKKQCVLKLDLAHWKQLASKMQQQGLRPPAEIQEEEEEEAHQQARGASSSSQRAASQQAATQKRGRAGPSANEPRAKRTK